MAVIEPSGVTGYNLQKWKRGVEGATYQKMKFIPTIDDEERLYGQLNIRKHARVSAATLAQSHVGTSLVASTLAGTPVALTPAGNYIMVAWSENEDAQIDFSLSSEARGEVEQAMAEASDQSALANAASLTQFVSGGSIDAAMWREAVGKLMGNTNGVAEVGEAKIRAVISHNQYPALCTIPEFNAADVRGDSENPYVKGIFMKAGGVFVILTTVVTQDDNGWHQPMYIPSAFAISWNRRTSLEDQKFELQNKVIAYNNFGSGVKHDLRAIDLRTTDSQID